MSKVITAFTLRLRRHVATLRANVSKSPFVLSVAKRSRSANGFYKLLISFISGFIAAYAFAPTYYVLLLFISFPVLLHLLFHSDTYRKSFWIGWAFGFGLFMNGLYWISYSLLVEKDMFGWLVPFAVTIIPAVLALYTGIVAVALLWLSKLTSIPESKS